MNSQIVSVIHFSFFLIAYNTVERGFYKLRMLLIDNFNNAENLSRRDFNLKKT